MAFASFENRPAGSSTTRVRAALRSHFLFFHNSVVEASATAHGDIRNVLAGQQANRRFEAAMAHTVDFRRFSVGCPCWITASGHCGFDDRRYEQPLRGGWWVLRVAAEAAAAAAAASRRLAAAATITARSFE